MRSRLFVLIALVALGALVASAPASAASRDVRAKKKAACSLKKKAKCKKAKLKNIKVGKQNLSSANLKGATITGGTFTGTNLSNADLSGATLKNVKFSGVNLAGADFSNARLVDVRFDHVRRGGKSTRSEVACADGVTLPASQGVDSTTSVTWFKGCQGAYSKFQLTRFQNVVFSDSDFSSASFHSSTFNGVLFLDSNFMGATFEAATMQGVEFKNTDVTGASFDFVTARDATIDTPDTTGASFFLAVGLTFKQAPRLPDMVHGLKGTARVAVSPGAGAPSYSQIAIKTKWDMGAWSRRTTCTSGPTTLLSGTCFAVGALGDIYEIKLEAPSPVSLSVNGAICGRPALSGSLYTATCTGTIGGDVAVTYVGQYTVQVKSVLQGGGATPMSKIRFESVATDGTRAIVKSCVLETSCSTSVQPGTRLRVSVFREHSNGYFGMNCPGETGDAFTNMLTEWPTGDDTLSGDAGDTTRYALRRICPAFEVTGNVTLTAVNDSPDGAPSG